MSDLVTISSSLKNDNLWMLIRKPLKYDLVIEITVLAKYVSGICDVSSYCD